MKKAEKGDIYLSPKQLAEMLDMKETTIAMARSRKRWTLPYYRVGKCVRYKLSDVEAWLEQRKVEGRRP